MRPPFEPEFDPLEVARGALASLSFISECSAREVHSGRIQEVFARSGIGQHVLIPTLEALGNLREVERLEYGYWLPTPPRKVSLDANTSLLVSVAPTIELQRHFPTVRRAGLGRVVATQQAAALPSQPLRAWLDFADIDTPTWARAEIESALSGLKPSIASADMEAFGIKATRLPKQGVRNEPAWLSSTDRRASVWRNVKLFRSRVSGRHYRYFLGRISNSGGLLEGLAVQDNLRLQYGFAALQGEPLTSSIRTKGDETYVRLPLSAPRSLYRLLSALCEPDPKSFSYRWVCRQTECWPTIEAALKDLGCEIANND